jgi:hypothetical protein
MLEDIIIMLFIIEVSKVGHKIKNIVNIIMEILNSEELLGLN